MSHTIDRVRQTLFGAARSLLPADDEQRLIQLRERDEVLKAALDQATEAAAIARFRENREAELRANAEARAIGDERTRIAQDVYLTTQEMRARAACTLRDSDEYRAAVVATIDAWAANLLPFISLIELSEAAREKAINAIPLPVTIGAQVTEARGYALSMVRASVVAVEDLAPGWLRNYVERAR